MGRNRARRLSPILVAALFLTAPCIVVGGDEENEILQDLLAEKSLALITCHRQAETLQTELAALQASFANNIPTCYASYDNSQGVWAELESAQEELAATEKVLQVSRGGQHLQDTEAGGQDLVAAFRKLSVTRDALARAQLELQRQHLRIEGAAAVAGNDSACQPVLLDLQECRDSMQLLQEHRAAAAMIGADGCGLERDLLAETRLRIAELIQEKEELQARLDEAVNQGNCNPSNAAVAGKTELSTAAVAAPGTSPRSSRRTELLQTQLLHSALEEVQQLEEENSQLRSRLGSLMEEASAATELRSLLDAATNRTSQLSRHLARGLGSLQATRQQVAALKEEVVELKASLAASQAHATSCQAHGSALQEALRNAEVAGEQCQSRLAIAETRGEDRLAAAQARAEAAETRSLELTEELARTAGSLSAAQDRLAELQRQGAELKSSLAGSQADAVSCQARESRLAAAAEEHQAQVEAAEARHARLHEEAQRRLAATEAALAEAEEEKAVALAARRAAEEALAALEAARHEAEVARAAAEAELRVTREANEAEVDRLMRVLDAREEANRELQQAAHMLKLAETAWLPLWAQRLAQPGISAAASWAAAAQQRLGSYWHAAGATVCHAVEPALALARRSLSRLSELWRYTLRPTLVKSVINYAEMEAAVVNSTHSVRQRGQAAAAKALARAAAAKAAVDASVLQYLHGLPGLSISARERLASGAVWAALAAVLLPITWLLLAAAVKAVLRRLQPGSVRVEHPGVEALARLQAVLGYRWQQQAGLQAALGGDSRGSTARLAWLGSALLQLLAAEAAFRQQPDSVGPAALEEAAEVLAGPAALGTKAEAASLSLLVLPGPGAKSHKLARDKAAELYAACVAAAYVDAGCKLDAARRVFNGPAPAANGDASSTASDGGATPSE